MCTDEGSVFQDSYISSMYDAALPERKDSAAFCSFHVSSSTSFSWVIVDLQEVI